MDQQDATSCADQGKSWRWIIDAYYGPNGWEIHDGGKPDFDSKSATSAGDGKVRIDWSGTGIWYAIVYRGVQQHPDVPPDWHKIATRGWGADCRCIRTAYTDSGLASGQTYMYKIELFNPRAKVTDEPTIGTVSGTAG